MKNPNYNKEDLLDHHAVAGIIKNDEGEILMQEHLKYGFWTIPVGKVKSGQNLLEGLKEEIFEECNLIIENCNQLLQRDYIYDREGKKVLVTEHLFEITKYSGILTNKEPHKHSQQKFMSLDVIKKLPYLSNFTLLFLKILGFERKPRI